MKKEIAIVSIVVAVIVGLAGGYFWGYAKGGAAVMASYAGKIDQLKNLLPVPTTLNSLSGKVTAVSGMTLTLAAASITPNPFADAFPAIREVTAISSTTITRATQTNPLEFQKEVQAYTSQIGKPGSPAVAAPSPVSQTVISLSDIKVGDTVTVTAGSNILDAASFTATTIQDQAPQ